jgi:hypothetical protein
MRRTFGTLQGTQEGPPRGVPVAWRRADAVGAQDPPDGRVTELVAQVNEFAVHSAVSSLWIFSGEPVDQFADLGVHRGTTWPIWVLPPTTHQATVPSQQRGGCDQPVAA